MNAPPSAAETVGKVRAILDGQTLFAGEMFSGFREGVGVVVTPLLPEEAGTGPDHEFTVTTGLPLNSSLIAGIALELHHTGNDDAIPAPLGETNQLGSLLFAPGPFGQEYRLSVAAAVVVEVTAPIRGREWGVGWFRREEHALGASTPGTWIAVEPGPVTLAMTPLDHSLWFTFPEAPTALGHGWARSRDGRVFHDVFPLRPALRGGTWEGRFHLPGDGAWEEVRVEPLTPAVLANLGLEARSAVADRLQLKLMDWGNEGPRPDPEPRYRELWKPLVAALAEPRKESRGMSCLVCRASARGCAAKVKGLHDGLAAAAPLCRSHLAGNENVILTAARNAWHREAAEGADVFAACDKLLAALLDDGGPVQRAFVHPYPPDEQSRAVNQAAGVLATVAALGRVRGDDLEAAAQSGAKAAHALQAAVGFDATPQRPAGRVTPANPHPLTNLWYRVAAHLAGDASQGYLAFRRLSDSITRHENDTQPFQGLRDRPVVVRPVLYDRERGAGVLARMEFTPTAEGCAELYLDVAALGLRIVDVQFLRGLALAWQAIRPAFLREYPGMSVCVRVVVGDDAAPAPALQGASAGLAAACALLALRHAEVLDSDTAVTGELLPGGTGTDLAGLGAGWTTRVPEKLAEARSRGLTRAVVGGDGSRNRAEMQRAPDPSFEVIQVTTVGEAYAALRRGPCVTAGQLQDDSKRTLLLRDWLNTLPASPGSSSRTLTPEVMRHLISAYRLLQDSGHDDSAQRLMTEFDTQARTQRARPATAQLGEILETLRYGLPREAVHLPRLEIGVEELLSRPGYPALLRAIRACEIDPPRAVREFEELLRQPQFQRSAFVLFLHGQALRKEDRLGEALQALERAEELIRTGADPVGDEIYLAVLRGLAAVCRKLGNQKLDRELKRTPAPADDDPRTWQQFRDRAADYFHAGDALVRRLPASQQSTAADFFHSRGYFEMQFGFQEWKLGGRVNTVSLEQGLARAAEFFGFATQSAPRWGAPDARQQLVRHKLAQIGQKEACRGLEAGYVRSRRKTGEEARGKPEAGLTEILCGCGLLVLGRGETVRLTPARLHADLAEALCRRVESRGARQCHDFDLEFLLDGMTAHPLGEVAALLRESASWDDLQYAQFVFKQARYRLVAGTATPQTVTAWVGNARKLVADHLHHDPANAAATELGSELASWSRGIGAIA